MKYILILFLLSIKLFGCSGNCVQCHPVLEKSIEKSHHQLLKTCINCHTKIPEGMSSCGGDCFACHSQNKLIKSNRVEHQGLGKCKECHLNKEDLLNFEEKSFNNNDSILDLMQNK